MLNNEKIILMTKLSLYEQKYEKKEIKTSKLFKSDYLALKLISSFVYGTIGYFLILALWFLYSSAAIVGELTKLGNFTFLVLTLVVLYCAIMVIYMIFCYAFYNHKFKKIRDNLKEYNRELKTLHRIQEMEYDAIIHELEEEGQE